MPFVGLCHGVQTTLDLIAGYCGIKDKNEITYTCGGINHMDWFLRLEHEGRDLYPELREKFEKPEYYKNEKVRGEVFRHFGYFMTESTGHLSEYVPWFRKNQAALDLYCDEPAFGGESGAYYKWGKTMAEKYAKVDPLQFEEHRHRPAQRRVLLLDHGGGRDRQARSASWATSTTTATSTTCRAAAAWRCRPSPTTPACIRRASGKLPPQCAAACMTNVNVQQLTADAALTGDPEHIVHALALDPLTAAVCTLKEIRDMASEMLEAQRQWLPEFGTQDPPDADDQHSEGCRAGGRPARSGAGDSQAVREVDHAEDGSVSYRPGPPSYCGSRGLRDSGRGNCQTGP